MFCLDICIFHLCMYLHFVFVLHQEHISCGQDAPHQLPQLRRKYNVHVCVYSIHVCTYVYTVYTCVHVYTVHTCVHVYTVYKCVHVYTVYTCAHMCIQYTRVYMCIHIYWRCSTPITCRNDATPSQVSWWFPLHGLYSYICPYSLCSPLHTPYVNIFICLCISYDIHICKLK